VVLLSVPTIGGFKLEDFPKESHCLDYDVVPDFQPSQWERSEYKFNADSFHLASEGSFLEDKAVPPSL